MVGSKFQNRIKYIIVSWDDSTVDPMYLQDSNLKSDLLLDEVGGNFAY